MDEALLRKIAKALIYPNKRDRFLLDMTRPCKDNWGGILRTQMEAVNRLPRIVDQSLALMYARHFPKPDALIALLRQNEVGENCFVISEDQDLLGVVAPLEEAVERLNANGFPSLIVGLPSGFAHLKEESIASDQPNWFVRPKVRLDGLPWNR